MKEDKTNPFGVFLAQEDKERLTDHIKSDFNQESFKPIFLKEEEIQVEEELEKYIRKQKSEELEKFKESLESEGIRDALVIANLEGKNVLVDGHHRFRVGKEIGIKDFPCKKIDFDDLESIKIWMLKNQLGRRNLTDAERIEIADKLTEFLIPKAKENQALSKGVSLSPNLAKVDRIKEIAELSGASTGNVKKFRKIKKEVSPEELEKVLAGEKSIHKAHTELKQNPNLKPSSLQGKLDVDVIRKEIKNLCKLSVPFLESSQFILSSFIKESIKDYRISKDYMKDVEEALEILNNSGILKDDVYVSRLEYFYNKTIRMINDRMSYPDYYDVIDEFREKAHSARDKYTTIKVLEKRLSEAREQAKS